MAPPSGQHLLRGVLGWHLLRGSTFFGGYSVGTSFGDRLFVSSAWGDNKGGAVLRVLEQDGHLAVERLWHAPLIDSEINTAVLVDGYLYGFKGSILVAVDAETGELEWSARGFGRGSLIAADGKLIVLGERGNLALVEASPGEYRELASAQILSGRSWTSPALAYGRLFVRNGEEIASLDLVGRRTGQRGETRASASSRWPSQLDEAARGRIR